MKTSASAATHELSYAELLKSIKHSPCTSYWLKNALTQLDNRDPIDAIDDAEFLLELMQKKCKELRIG